MLWFHLCKGSLLASLMAAQPGEDGPSEARLKPVSPFMQCFWDLSNIEEDSRVEAVNRLVAHVVAGQQNFEVMGSIAGSVPSNPSDAGAALGLCSDVEYAVKRCDCVGCGV